MGTAKHFLQVLPGTCSHSPSTAVVLRQWGFVSCIPPDWLVYVNQCLTYRLRWAAGISYNHACRWNYNSLNPRWLPEFFCHSESSHSHEKVLKFPWWYSKYSLSEQLGITVIHWDTYSNATPKWNVCGFFKKLVCFVFLSSFCELGHVIFFFFSFQWMCVKGIPF